MKILLISSTVFPIPPVGYAGLEKVVYDLAVGLKNAGHQVTVLATSYSKLPEGIEYVDCGEPNKISEQSMLDKVKERIHKPEWDIIHDHSWGKPIYLEKKANPKIKVISTLHGMCPYSSPPPVTYPNMVCLSKSHALETSGRLGINTCWCYDGLDVDFYQYQEKKGDRLLWLGRFMKGKGPHIAIEVSKKTGIPLDLVGDDTMVEDKDYVFRIMKMAQETNGLVRYWGPVSRERAAEFFRNAKVFLQCGLSPWCIIPGQSVKTNSQIKNIENVTNKDRVISEDGKYHRVLNRFSKHYIGEIIKIMPSMHGLPINVSPEHKLLTIKGKKCNFINNLVCKTNYKNGRCLNCNQWKNNQWFKYKKAKKMESHGFTKNQISRKLKIPETTLYYWLTNNPKWKTNIRKPGNRPYWKYYNPEWKTAEEIFNNPKDCYLSIPINQNIFDINKIEEIKIDRNVLRTLGFFVAEGSADETGNIHFGLGPNEESYAKEIVSTLKNSFGINANYSLRKYNDLFHKNCYRVWASSKKWGSKFVEWFGKGAINKKIPQWIYELPNEKISWFLQGLWRGDGCVSKRGQYNHFSYSTISKQLSFQIFDILLRLKIFPNLRKKNQGKRSFGKNPIYLVNVNGDSFKLSQVLGWAGFKETRNKTRWKSLGFFMNNKLWIPIRKVEKIDYDGMVYDLQIEDAKNYTCEGISCHNSEPFGLVTIESLACGTPVIALRNGATTELIENYNDKKLDRVGILCNNLDEMVEAVKSQNFTAIKPQMCREYAETFARDKMALNYVKLYERILSNKEW